MLEFNLGMAIELLVAVLLVVTIGYCMLLNRRLTRLRADEVVLRATIGELLSATEVAERAIQGLKQTAVDCDLTLGVRMKAAETVIASLQAQMETAEKWSRNVPRPQSIGQTMAQAAAHVPAPRAPAPAPHAVAHSYAPQAPVSQVPMAPGYGHGHVPQGTAYGQPTAPAYHPTAAASALEVPFAAAMYDGPQMAPPQARQMMPPAYAPQNYAPAPQPYAAPVAPPVAAPAPSAARNVQAAAAQAADRLRAYRKSGGGEAA